MASCRHCVSASFEPSYASVALLGTRDLRDSVELLESRGIVPCVSAVCGKCGRLSVLVRGDERAPFVHSLAMWERLGRHLVQDFAAVTNPTP